MSKLAISNQTSLILPYPMELGRQFGALSLDASGMPMSIRLHQDDKELLTREAEWLRVKPSAIARWLVVYGAQQLAFVRTGRAPVVRP